MSAGQRGPLLLKDFILHEDGALQPGTNSRRLVHAKGTGAYGIFTVTCSIPKTFASIKHQQ